MKKGFATAAAACLFAVVVAVLLFLVQTQERWSPPFGIPANKFGKHGNKPASKNGKPANKKGKPSFKFPRFKPRHLSDEERKERSERMNRLKNGFASAAKKAMEARIRQKQYEEEMIRRAIAEARKAQGHILKHGMHDSPETTCRRLSSVLISAWTSWYPTNHHGLCLSTEKIDGGEVLCVWVLGRKSSRSSLWRRSRCGFQHPPTSRAVKLVVSTMTSGTSSTAARKRWLLSTLPKNFKL